MITLHIYTFINMLFDIFELWHHFIYLLLDLSLYKKFRLLALVEVDFITNKLHIQIYV
jgi:hypothetical protein